jgi:formylglycine-generating enzyme
MVRLLSLTLLAGCTAVLGIDEDYQLAPSTSATVGGGGAGGSGAGGTSGCPTDMVAVLDFCIDVTEVTLTAYRAFISSGQVPALTQKHCVGRATFNPGASTAGDAGPVTEVDICDAHGYCSWAGRELCGRPSGGEAGEATLVTSSAWYAACAGVEGRSFPYGDSHQPQRCVDASYGVAGPEPVGVAATCQSPEGALDLVGNVAEWEHSCAHSILCRLRGGSFASNANAASCAAVATARWDEVRPDIGFRCCTPRP